MKTERWFNDSYEKLGMHSERLYPNEELLRFFGRNYFSKTYRVYRNNTRVLELGCGSCSNLWMVAREGFDTYGIDLSKEGINIGRKMLFDWDVTAKLVTGSMTELPYEDNYFDVIFDVFSAYCLNEKEFGVCLDEVKRCLKVGGKFFSYSPSSESYTFIHYKPSEKIDEWTLDGIKRDGVAYSGQMYPFRFISEQHYKELLEERGFSVPYLESVGRTNNGQVFKFVTVEGIK